MAKVSIVIPAYNCEKTIERMINSVKAQNFSDFEVLLINDGSTDNTLHLLNKLSKNDPQFRVITLKNAGPARARNDGLRRVKSEYVIFLDADDFLEKDMLFSMIFLADVHNLDVTCCSYQIDNLVTNTNQAFTFEDTICKSKEEFYPYFLPLVQSHLMYAVWNKLYKTDFLKDNSITFDDFKTGEDRLFNLKTFEKLNSFGVISKPLYHYTIHSKDSLVNKYIDERFDVAVQCHHQYQEYASNIQVLNSKTNKILTYEFLKMVTATVISLYSSTCTLDKNQKLEIVKEIVTHPEVVKASKTRKKIFSPSGVVSYIYRTQNPFLVIKMSKGITFMKTYFNSLFMQMKQKSEQ